MMRRCSVEVRSPEQIRIKSYKIKQIVPKIFFTKCEKCNYEFRKTVMWTWLKSRWDWDKRYYGCTSCFPNYQDVLSHLETKEE